MRRKILSILLAVSMVICFIPQTVFAGTITIKDYAGQIFTLDNVETGDSIDNIKAKLEDKTGLKPASCTLIYGGKHLEDGKTLADYNITSTNGVQLYLIQTVWTNVDTAAELKDALTSAISPIAIRLAADITVSETLEIDKSVILNLDGHVLQYKNDATKGSVIEIGSGGYLGLTDSNSGNLTHKFTVNNEGLWTLDENNGTKTISGGVITGGNADNGGGIYVYGTLNMFGGSIAGCTAQNGGGVYMDGKSLTLNGGKIIGCTATGNGGGVYFKKELFDIESGGISDCHAKNGGAIFICDVEKPAEDSNTYKINMSGGSISDCSASGSGGGIYIQAGDFNMTGGTITNCKAGEYGDGGGIYMAGAAVSYPKSCKVEISGGTISGCSAYVGRGIYAADNKGTLIIRGGKISNDCSDENDKIYDVHIHICNFTMSGGEVSGIHIDINNGTQIISGGTVYACDIQENDAVIYNGIFYGNVTNYGTISGGMYYGTLTNNNTGKFADNCCEVKYMRGDELYATQIVKSGSKATAPIMKGYAVESCYTDPNCSDDKKFNLGSTPITTNITLYTSWAEKSGYTVKFDTGGGSSVNDRINVKWTDKVLEDVDNPIRAGYYFRGWKYGDVDVTSEMTYKDLVPDDDATGDTITLAAQWEKKPVYHIVQKPTVTTPEHGTITLSYNGRTATIIPDEGYEITAVKVNDIEKGAVTTVTGLRTGDRIEVTFAKTKATLDAEVKDAVAGLDSMKARTSKTSKGNIKVVLNLSDEEKVIIANFKEQGYTVKYRFYRSTKKSSGYAARIEKDTDTFINTVGSKGTRYYYKVRIMVYDESGNIVAKTALSDCKYASRVR